jgi:hypothetical protein
MPWRCGDMSIEDCSWTDWSNNDDMSQGEDTLALYAKCSAVDDDVRRCATDDSLLLLMHKQTWSRDSVATDRRQPTPSHHISVVETGKTIIGAFHRSAAR